MPRAAQLAYRPASSLALALASSALCSLLAGCALHPAQPSPAPTILRGKLHGGEQPISLATIKMYAANTSTTAGASTSLLTTSVQSDQYGNFTITGDYSCTANGMSNLTPVYLVATGGNPGLTAGTNNAAITIMAALGPCNTLTSSTAVDIDEVTTVAAAYALSNYMTDATHVGASTLSAITNAFTLASELANNASGLSPGATVPAGSYVPSTKLNTLANILAYCVDSDGSGATGNTTPCGKVFTATTYSGAMPTNILGAAIKVNTNPSTSVSNLFSLAGAIVPFTPQLTSSPSDWTMTIASASWATPSAITYGTALSSTQLDATATVPGSFNYSPASGTLLTAGTQSLTTTFTPTDTADYPNLTPSVSLTVNKATPTITWSTPSAITAGTALSSTQLDATTPVAGSFSYTPASGTLLNDGSQTLSTLFTPTDTTDYNTANKSVSLTVNNAVPTYTFGNVAIVGGGYISGIVCHPTTANLRYVRTDVGGAYKWNSTTSKWVPLTDFNSRANYSFGGTDSIALDPHNDQMLFMTVGEYTESYGVNGEFLISSNQGASFTTVTAGFKMGSNDNGRTAGERLAVDPNKGSILFYGSYNDGLWTSTNTGSSWTKNSTFPVTGATSGAGIVFVDFIASSSSSGTATPDIYVGVSDTGPSSSTGFNGLYRSTDGGSTWAAVPGQPTGYFPIHGLFAPDGNLYVTYSNGIGPSGITAGQVWSYTPPANTSPTGNGTWTNITPTTPERASGSQGGFNGLAVDPNNSGVIYTSTIDDYYPGDDIYVSTNSGSTWKSVLNINHSKSPVITTATYNTSLSPWVLFGASAASNSSAGTWPGALAVDPANSDHFMYGTGQTLWDSTNIQNAQSGSTTAFSIGAAGIEETVVQALASPPSGALLYSGVSDLGGFVHTSLTTSPSGGMIESPRLSPITSIDYAQSAPANVAFVGSNGTTAPFGSFSANSGSSWTPFAAQAPGTTAGGGTIALSADGTTLVWAPSDAPVAYSTNNGTTWTASTSATAESGVIADRINASKFYILTSAGTLQISTNKGASFSTAATGLNTYGVLAASYAAEGDLWLGSSSGLYHSTNSGTSFTKVSGPTAAYSIGFGAAAPYSSYPTIFIIGNTAAGYGFFRSTDEGSTWVQMNTTANQYGYANPIVGDPKTFGTFYLGTGGRGIIVGSSPN